jgi:catechol 2,3-dioxygenase-like lactoylglutathione lyase family enzyme
MNLNQVTIPSHDLVTAVEFYKQLGLQLIVASIPRYARFQCPSGDSTFSIHHVEHPIQTEGLTVYFECPNLDDRCSELQKQGVNFDMEPTDQLWLWREAHLRDPDGNRLILFYAGQNRKNPPWRIGSTADNGG